MVEVLYPNSIIMNRSLIAPAEYNNYRVIDTFVDFNENEYVANDTKEKVQRQVEWYFSDENLRKDAFLMKHIARNKQGFVSLKLVASLRKIKSITKDCKMVADGIKYSKCLELSEDGTKVRRLDPIPTVDYSSIPKTIIVTKYSINNDDDLDVVQIQDEYSRYGQVSRVIILYPGKSVPLFVKSCKSRFPCIGKEVCILVEYETVEMAKRAYKECKQSWRQTATVQLLSSQQDQQTKTEINEDSKMALEKKNNKKKISPESSRVRHGGGASSNGYNSDSGYSGIGSRSPSSSPKSSPPPSRRFFTDTLTPIRKTRPLLMVSKPKQATLVNITRTPFGPDGTKGFNFKR